MSRLVNYYWSKFGHKFGNVSFSQLGFGIWCTFSIAAVMMKLAGVDGGDGEGGWLIWWDGGSQLRVWSPTPSISGAKHPTLCLSGVPRTPYKNIYKIKVKSVGYFFNKYHLFEVVFCQMYII